MATDSELPDDFTARVLRRTSGSACEAAELLLPAFVEGGLERTERELVGGHVRNCRACGALAAALPALASDLRSFAEVAPDPAFVDDVLALTCDALPERLPRDMRWRGRLQVLLLRPRFSLEAAFAASILFGLFFGVPEPRFGSGTYAALADELRAGAREPVAAVHRLWDRAGEPVVESLETTGEGLLRTARDLARSPVEAGSPSPAPSPHDGAHPTDSPGENR